MSEQRCESAACEQIAVRQCDCCKTWLCARHTEHGGIWPDDEGNPTVFICEVCRLAYED